MTPPIGNPLRSPLNMTIVALALLAGVLLMLLGVKRLAEGSDGNSASPDRQGQAQVHDQQPGIPVVWTDRPLGPLGLAEIRVDKSDQVLTVFDAGLPVKSYRAAIGQVPGDKQVEGDRKTPEGEFYVCLRQGRGQTRFTRALGLSYPNAEDARRGLAAGIITQRDYDRIVYEIDRGRQPPWNTPLGGQILIHGEYENSGPDTAGCVRLSDRDILELFPRIPVGTRVIIQP